MDDLFVPSGFGIEILQCGSRYYLKCDAGELVVRIREIELSEEDVVRAAQSEKAAYEVILRRTSGDHSV